MAILTERIPAFVQLDDVTSFYKPANGHNNAAIIPQNKQQDPDLLVFCSWMNGASKHIAIYTAAYQRLFPSTAIVLIESRLRDMFIPHAFTAAVNVIISYATARSPWLGRSGPSIILHAISNGGANQAATLATRLKERNCSPPFDAITLDCAPGKTELVSAARAIRLSIPDVFFARTVAMPLIYFFLAVHMVYCSIPIISGKDKIGWIRDTLNDHVLLGVNVPRLYLYSRKDLLVEAQHVAEHAEDARRKGCGKVVEVVFENAPHVALVFEDAERYWDAIEKHARQGVRGE